MSEVLKKNSNNPNNPLLSLALNVSGHGIVNWPISESNVLFREFGKDLNFFFINDLIPSLV